MSLENYFFIAGIVFLLEFRELLKIFHKTNPFLKNIPLVGEFGLSLIAVIIFALAWPGLLIYVLGWIVWFFAKSYSNKTA